jgi:hypothetical protein
MKDAKSDAAPRSTVNVERPERADLQATIHALHGILWALDMLVVNQAADGIANETDRAEGIAGLIWAGEQLAEEMAERF